MADPVRRRRRAETRRAARINIKLSVAELEEIRARAHEAGVTMSRYVLSRVLPPPAVPDEDVTDALVGEYPDTQPA
jgi:hypothetical protein